MRRILFFMLAFVAASVSVSCVDEVSDPSVFMQELTFSASCQSETKTALVAGNEVYWLPGDQIAVSGASDPFVTDIAEPSGFTQFTGAASSALEYYAVYPYASLKSWDGSTATVEIPQIQTAVKGTFADDLNISVASTSSEDMLFRFHNVLGYVKFTVSEQSGSIKSVTVSAIGNEPLAGDVQVDCSSDSPSASYVENSESYVTLTSEAVLEPGNYYIAMLPGTYASGLEFTFMNDKGLVATKKITCELTISAGQIRNIGEMKGLEFEESIETQLAKEREALIAIYNALDGDNWTNNENWCSDKPVSEWYGVSVDGNGFIVYLCLENNNLRGNIPESIADLVNLQYLILQDNKLTGEIPQWITNLHHLEMLNLANNQLEGSIPQELYKIKDIVFLSFANNQLSGEIPDDLKHLNKVQAIYLSGNKLSGPIPDWISKYIVSGGGIMLYSNNFTGEIPESVMTHPEWVNYWFYIIAGNNFDLTNVIIPAPEFELKDILGNNIQSKQLYDKYEYIIHYQWASWCGFSEAFTPILVDLTNQYKDKVYTIGAAFETTDIINSYNDRHNVSWITYQQGPDNKIRKSESIGYDEFYPDTIWPSVTVFESKSRTVVFTDVIKDRNSIVDFFKEKLDGIQPDYYTSTDYTQDEKVTTLQTATKGDGIDIVLLGDAYSDRQIADETYEADMKNLYNNLFTEEPYKSFKDHFNVYYVNAVSATEGYEHGGSAFGGYFGDGTLVGGNDNAVFDYALNAIAEEEMDEALIIVAMNSDAYAGTCYMYYPESATGTYGSGPAVAYFPKGGDQTTFAQLLHHEANGHGFAKLADEYAYEDMGAVPTDYVTQTRDQQNNWGWWKNVDFTSDPEQVRWSYFLDDERYANEGLGVFEGGLTYWSGVWRPTEDSIMRYNTGGFNAPSREAIYYRIHKLAYGDSWEYDYEDFVEYDKVNRSTSASAPQKTRRNYVERPLEPTAPPVIVGKSWKDVK